MANKYIRQGAAGTGSGDDWTNAYTTFSGITLTRGDTYYIATGSYAGRTCNTAASGSTLITIKGATVADHGTDTGWSASYSVSAADGGSQALFTSAISFQTSYWVFDSTVYPPTPAHSTARTKTAYGFRYTSNANPFSVYNLSSAITTITIKGVSGTAPAGDLEKFFIATDNSTQSVDFLTVSHNYGDGYSNFTWGTSAGLAMSDWTHEYNLVTNGFSSASNHGEDLNNNYSNMTRWTIRYNWFEDRGSGTACIVALNNDVTSYFIYGNVFFNMTVGDGCCTGVINGEGTQELRGVVYNNTFVQQPGSTGGWIGTAVLSTVKNNLLYDMSASIGSGTASSSVTYTAYWDTTNTPSSGTEPTRYVGTGDPFTNLAGKDYTLTSSAATAMTAGETLSSPYDVDMFGNTRGADGKWDRGAFEFVASTKSPTDKVLFRS